MQLLGSPHVKSNLSTYAKGLLQAENIAIVFFDDAGIIQDYSVGFEKMMGFRKDFFRNKPLYSLPFSKIEEMLGFPEINTNLADSQSFRTVKFINGSGAIGEVDLHLNISRKGEKIIGGSIIIDKIKKEEDLRNFSQFLLTKSEFHLKEPLRIAKMFADMMELKVGKDSDKESREFTFFISKNLKKLETLLVHLILLENLNFKKLEPSIVNTEMLWLLELQKRNDECKVKFGPHPPDIVGDKSLLKLLIHNVLEFAENYAVNVEKHFEFSADREGDWQVLHFVFNGMDFINNHKFSTVAPIHRAIDISNLPASGYELMIINKIVELMEGNLSLGLLNNGHTHLKIQLPSRLQQIN